MLAGHHLAKPRAVYGFFERIENDAFLYNDESPVVLAICTIGSALEEEVRELTRKNQLASATALDAVGSEMVESLAEALETRICKEAAMQSLSSHPRFSPGYGDWSLASGQNTIFSLLPSHRVGVSLSDTFLMNPLKSISFAMRLSTSAPTEPRVPKCALCGEESCPYRR
ncbi:MAG: vitamin B12 dependent-methionine synthase activation domain-containing protein, partial [bacterium]